MVARLPQEKYVFMSLSSLTKIVLAPAAVGLVLLAVGCGSRTESSSVAPMAASTAPFSAKAEGGKAQASAATATASVIHPHKAGQHGGVIVPIGADSYHTEAVVEATGELRLLMLGQDESRVLEVELQPLTAYVKATGGAAAVAVPLASQPQEGDAAGKTSQFVGRLPTELRGKQIEATIPSLRIDGARFRVGFSTAASHAEEMPPSLPEEEEQSLYLKPAGKYSEADIAANGGVTAAAKFRGLMASHDMKPKSGDRICPVTMTKANPKFTWVIDGKSYQFCCPPCVDEYVKLAKEQPNDLRPPESFVK